MDKLFKMEEILITDQIINSKNKNGFTLIELSIVLVIIGLIVGGILTGQELIHGASVRATISQLVKYSTAVNTFQQKYNALPGDFANATNYINVTNLANGNGDGLIGSVAGLATPLGTTAQALGGGATYVEYSSFWASLSALGLIEGNYAIQATAGNTLLVTGAPAAINLPATKINASNGIIAYGNSGDTNNYYQLGVLQASNTAANNTVNNILSPGDAFSIDSKMDDGNPISGSVVARGGTTGLEMLPSNAGAVTLASAAVTNSCIYGAAAGYTTTSTLYYNTGASSTAQLCSLRVKM